MACFTERLGGISDKSHIIDTNSGWHKMRVSTAEHEITWRPVPQQMVLDTFRSRVDDSISWASSALHAPHASFINLLSGLQIIFRSSGCASRCFEVQKARCTSLYSIPYVDSLITTKTFDMKANFPVTFKVLDTIQQLTDGFSENFHAGRTGGKSVGRRG